MEEEKEVRMEKYQRANWRNFGVKEGLAKALEANGFSFPKRVQEAVLNEFKDYGGGARAGGMAPRSLIVQEDNGEGKTLAFSVPILNFIDPLLPTNEEKYSQRTKRPQTVLYPQAIILIHTTLLAHQHYETLFKLQMAAGSSHNFHKMVIGTFFSSFGESKTAKSLPGINLIPAHVMIGTVMKVFHERKSVDGTLLSFSKLRFLVVDEADQTLRDTATKNAFLEWVMKDQIPSSCNVILISATYTQSGQKREKPESMLYHLDIMDTVSKRKWKEIQFSDDIDFNSQVIKCLIRYSKQKDNKGSFKFIEETIKELKPDGCFIFSNEKDFNEELQITLTSSMSENIGLIQRDRKDRAENDEIALRVLDDMRNKRIKVVVCTNLGNRGVDIPSVQLVINYDYPVDFATKKVLRSEFIHRTGRTGRNSRPGIAVSIIKNQMDEKLVRSLQVPMHEITEKDIPKLKSMMAEIKRGNLPKPESFGLKPPVLI